MLFDIFKTPVKTVKDFILISALLSLVDRPLKNSVKWEDAGVDDISDLEIDADELMKNLRGTLVDEDYDDSIDEWSLYGSILENIDDYRESEGGAFGSSGYMDNFSEVKFRLEESIKGLPFRKIIEPQSGHREVFQEICCRIVAGLNSSDRIQTTRAMALWLFMLALDIDKGEITPNKSALIDDFRNALGIEDDVLEDLQERAISLHKELAKTMTIINE